MTNSERILNVLGRQKPGAGICDDCLETLAQVHPRQQVNQICRRLAIDGLIVRKTGVCSAKNHGREKEINLIAGGGSPLPTGPPEQVNDPPGLEEQTTVFSDWLNTATKSLNRIEKVSSSNEFFAARISRLREEGKIPQALSRKLLTLNSFRNQVVKERKALDRTEWNLAKKYLIEARTELEGIGQVIG